MVWSQTLPQLVADLLLQMSPRSSRPPLEEAISLIRLERRKRRIRSREGATLEEGIETRVRGERVSRQERERERERANECK